MDQPRIYPTGYSDADLAREAAELSRRVTAYDPRSGNGEDLIKDSVLFNVTYIELQNRTAHRVSRLMTWLTCLSAAVAAASLLVAWFAYETARAGDKWQEQQIRTLVEISTHLSTMSALQQNVAAQVLEQLKSTSAPPQTPDAGRVLPQAPTRGRP